MFQLFHYIYCIFLFIVILILDNIFVPFLCSLHVSLCAIKNTQTQCTAERVRNYKRTFIRTHLLKEKGAYALFDGIQEDTFIWTNERRRAYKRMYKRMVKPME